MQVKQQMCYNLQIEFETAKLVTLTITFGTIHITLHIMIRVGQPERKKNRNTMIHHEQTAIRSTSVLTHS